VTGRDRTDALVEALRQPALPTELVGEAAAIASMVGTLTGAAAPRGVRSRKGAAIVAITAASLGVGGLAAAGPEIFPRVLDFGRAALPEQVQPDIASESAPPAVSPPDAVISNPSNPAMPAAPGVVAGRAHAAQPADPGVSPAVPADPETAGPPAHEDDDLTTATSCVGDAHDDVVVAAAQTTEEDADPVPEVARPDCGNAVTAGPPDSTPGNDDPGAPTEAVRPSAVQPVGGPDPSTGTKSVTTPIEPQQPQSPEPGGPETTPPASTPPASTPPTSTSPVPPTPGNPSAPASPPVTLPTPPASPPMTLPAPLAPAAPGVPVVPAGSGAPDRAANSTERRASARPAASVATESGWSAVASEDLVEPGPGARLSTP
jgi:hypothetical protein